MQQLKNGVWLLVVLSTLSSCRSSKPPALSVICLGDGFGGADCVLANGEKLYKAPSELKNFWMTTNADMQNFSAWCYQSDVGTSSAAMSMIAGSIHDQPSGN